MRRELRILTSPWFLLALGVLLLNDFLLKGLYGNWITGKLSDFAGLFAFALFWSALLPNRRREIVVLTGLLFLWWKSPFSHSFLDLWNTHVPIQIGRVVDYSDLIALAVLPAAYRYHDRASFGHNLKISPIIPLCVSAFAFMATSTRGAQVEVHKTYVLDMGKAEFGQRLGQLDSLNLGQGVQLTQENPEDIELEVPSDLCFDSFSAKVTVAELSNGKTLLTLVRVFHSCPGGDEDKAEATEDFEAAVINRLTEEDSLR